MNYETEISCMESDLYYLDLQYNFDTPMNFYKQCVKLIYCSDFNWREFLDSKWECKGNLPFIKQFFKGMWKDPKLAKEQYLTYLADTF